MVDQNPAYPTHSSPDKGGLGGGGEMNWVCYLLRCGDGTLYCGITNDMAKRLAAHNAGTAAKYTRSRIPVVLVYTEACADRSVASKREMAIKKLARSEKLALCVNFVTV